MGTVLYVVCGVGNIKITKLVQGMLPFLVTESIMLFLLLFFSLMRYRDIRRMLPFALLGAGLTWLVFEKILGVVVPQPFWLGLF